MTTAIDRRRNALLHRIHRRFPTITAPLHIGGLQFPFTRVADPDRILDEVAEAEDLRIRLGNGSNEPQHLPYWAEVWDSAVGLSRHLVERFADLSGRDVLDLGCGQGLAGCVAAALGAKVLLADLEAPALLLARLNSLAHSRAVRTRVLNWQSDRLDESFDLILGADILYDRTQWPHLNAFWRAHLREGGCIVLAEPGRASGTLFLEWITDWTLERFEQPVPNRPTPIHIFQLKPMQQQKRSLAFVGQRALKTV